METLKRAEFGNPALRQKAKKLTPQQLKSARIKSLIKNMRHTLLSEKLGVGLAAPQIGESVAIAVVAIRSRTHRPEVQPFDLVMVNPEIVKFIGRRSQMWEGCLSGGKGGLFAKVPRYKKVELKY